MSARRQARAVHAAAPTSATEPDLTALFRDLDADLWSDADAYRAFMEARGWPLTAADRFGHDTHPANRRNHAAAAWARENGITDDTGSEWSALRRLGLIDLPSERTHA